MCAGYILAMCTIRWVTHPGYVPDTLGISWIHTLCAGSILDICPLHWAYPEYIPYTLCIFRIYAPTNWVRPGHMPCTLGMISASRLSGFSGSLVCGGMGGVGATKRAPN